MATNKIEQDPALIRLVGLIARSISRCGHQSEAAHFNIHTGMSLGEDVDLETFVMAKDELSGADIKAVCTEAGLLALKSVAALKVALRTTRRGQGEGAVPEEGQRPPRGRRIRSWGLSWV